MIFFNIDIYIYMYIYRYLETSWKIQFQPFHHFITLEGMIPFHHLEMMWKIYENDCRVEGTSWIYFSSFWVLL